MTTGNKIMWKRGEIAPQEQFLLFSTLYIYIYISNFRSQITYSFIKCTCSIYYIAHSLNSDMSKYGYLELFQWVPWSSRYRGSTVFSFTALCNLKGNKTCNKTCATSAYSDQPAHLRSLIRVFADPMCLLQPPGYPKMDEREPLPFLVDVQADLSL